MVARAGSDDKNVIIGAVLFGVSVQSNDLTAVVGTIRRALDILVQR
jgi:hypothetical protein